MISGVAAALSLFNRVSAVSVPVREKRLRNAEAMPQAKTLSQQQVAEG